MAGDFQHESPATLKRGERRKHLRIQFAAEATEFGQRVAVKIFRLPRDEAVPWRQFRIGNFVLGKIEFHSESTEIPHDHIDAVWRSNLVSGTDRSETSLYRTTESTEHTERNSVEGV